jgi:hypothetical protein
MNELLRDLAGLGIEMLSNLSIPALIIGPWGASEMFKHSSATTRLGVGLGAFALGGVTLIALRRFTGFPLWLDWLW